MAITYPRAMLCGVSTVSFELLRGVVINRLAGGITQVHEVSEPRWTAHFDYAPLRRINHQLVQSWLDSLRGGTRDFYGHDPLKPFPLSYPAGNYPVGYTGNGPINSISVNGFNLILTTNFLLHAGDMVGLAEGANRGLFRILETVNTGGGTGALVTVEPRVNLSLFTNAATAWLTRPVCVMTLDPTSVQISRTAGLPGSVSFAGIQKVY